MRKWLTHLMTNFEGVLLQWLDRVFCGLVPGGCVLGRAGKDHVWRAMVHSIVCGGRYGKHGRHSIAACCGYGFHWHIVACRYAWLAMHTNPWHILFYGQTSTSKISTVWAVQGSELLKLYFFFKWCSSDIPNFAQRLIWFLPLSRVTDDVRLGCLGSSGYHAGTLLQSSMANWRVVLCMLANSFLTCWIIISSSLPPNRLI